VAVVDKFHATDRADAFEKLFQVVFGGIVGEISHVEARSFYNGRSFFFVTGLAAVALALFIAAFSFHAATAGDPTGFPGGLPGGLPFAGVGFIGVLIEP
jgi:hypothetical protein